ncbi:MAG: ribonuclease J [Proteobacteria bacterium]|nr:ribonuclease J [Pseudomonadota bacterium]
MVKIVPLGGLGEIGLNMMVVEYQNTAVIIDVGLMFPEDDMLGIDIVIPDLSYIRKIRSDIVGIILTHAHEDHIGALPYLLREIKTTVYGTPFTLGVVKRKLEEHGLLPATVFEEINPLKTISLGKLDIEFVRVGHSTIDGVGLAIRTPYGLIVHTGDFKINHTAVDGMITDVNRFAQFGKEGVLALLSDSTNVEQEGYTVSDQIVSQALEKIASGCKGRLIIALFASNVARIQQVVDISQKMGRKIVFNGRSIELTVKLAKELGHIHIPDGVEAEIGQLSSIEKNRVVIVTTGSQGEPMSALARMATGDHKQIKIREDDTVVLSSKFIPGNEKAIAGIINSLYRLGADVIYEKISEIHVSGHAFQEELKLMINLTKPRFFVPIHGEYRHLTHHMRLAESVGIPRQNILFAENGRIIGFDEQGGRLLGTVPTGRILVDGKGIGDISGDVLRERRILSEDGLVIVTMIFDEETGVVMSGPDLVSRGFVSWIETGHLLDDAQCVVLEIVEDVGFDTPGRINIIRSRIQKALRQYFYFTIRRKPIIVPIILEH